jgi:peroxiredoxin
MDVVRSFAEEHALTFRILSDAEGAAGRLYRVRGIPATYIIDDAGKVAEVHMGPISRQQIDRYAAALTAE